MEEQLIRATANAKMLEDNDQCLKCALQKAKEQACLAEQSRDRAIELAERAKEDLHLLKSKYEDLRCQLSHIQVWYIQAISLIILLKI